MPHEQYLYFIVAPEAVKIGLTRHPRTRLLTLAQATWVELEMVACLSGATMTDEQRVHAEVANAALAREWFTASDPNVKRILALAKGCSTVQQLLQVLAGALPLQLPTSNPTLRLVHSRPRKGIQFNQGAKRLMDLYPRFGDSKRLAQSLGFDRSLVSRWRSGATLPNARARARMSEVLGVPVTAWDESLPWSSGRTGT